MATSIAKTSVAVGMDASAFKTGADSLKDYFKDIGATAGKLVGVLGLYQFGLGGIKKGIEASLGKVVAFEKTQAILEAIGKTAGDSKESIANLVSTLSTITGRNDEAGKALGDISREMMSIGFSAAETEKMVSSFYKVAKASPAEIGETYETLKKMVINIDQFGFAGLKQYKAVAQLGIPIMDIMAAKLSELRGVTVTADEVAHQLKEAEKSGGREGITRQEGLQVFAGLGDSELVQAQIDAIGGTFAGAMKKSKEEISLMFFEIGKAINAFFGGTKTYVSIFKMITAGVKVAREQVELLVGVFANNRQWIENFKNGIHILVVAFFRLFEVIFNAYAAYLKYLGRLFDAFTENIPAIENALGRFFSSAKNMANEFFSDVASGFVQWATYGAIPFEKSTRAIKGMATATDAGTTRVSYMQEIFKGFGEYMTDFSNNFQAIFKVWDVIMDSFGDGVNNVTNIWEGMYEIIQTINAAGQVGLLAIGEIGINSINGILKIFEDMAAFTQKWIDKFSYGLARILEVLGIVNKGTAEAMGAVDQARGEQRFNLGRISTNGMAEGRAAIQAQAEEERRARIKMYNERKLGLAKDQPEADKPDFKRGGPGGAGSQLAAPTLLSAGGAEEYKLIVERNNAKLMDGTKKTNDLLEQANGHLETIAGNRPIAPAMTVVPLIPRG